MAHELLITFPDEETRREFVSKLDNDLWGDYGDDWQHLLENHKRIFYELPDQERIFKDLKCKIICGAANNQLDITDPEEANRQLVANDILYIPDTLANAGGVFRSAGIILKTRDEQDSFKLIKTFYDRTLAIINIAEENKISPADVCKHIGQGITGKPNKFKIMLDNLKH